MDIVSLYHDDLHGDVDGLSRSDLRSRRIGLLVRMLRDNYAVSEIVRVVYGTGLFKGCKQLILVGLIEEARAFIEHEDRLISARANMVTAVEIRSLPQATDFIYAIMDEINTWDMVLSQGYIKKEIEWEEWDDEKGERVKRFRTVMHVLKPVDYLRIERLKDLKRHDLAKRLGDYTNLPERPKELKVNDFIGLPDSTLLEMIKTDKRG